MHSIGWIDACHGPELSSAKPMLGKSSDTAHNASMNVHDLLYLAVPVKLNGGQDTG